MSCALALSYKTLQITVEIKKIVICPKSRQLTYRTCQTKAKFNLLRKIFLVFIDHIFNDMIRQLFYVQLNQSYKQIFC